MLSVIVRYQMRGKPIMTKEALVGHLSWLCRHAGVVYSDELYDLAIEAQRCGNEVAPFQFPPDEI